MESNAAKQNKMEQNPKRTDWRLPEAGVQGVGEMGEEEKKVQTSNYEINVMGTECTA